MTQNQRKFQQLHERYNEGWKFLYKTDNTPKIEYINGWVVIGEGAFQSKQRVAKFEKTVQTIEERAKKQKERELAQSMYHPDFNPENWEGKINPQYESQVFNTSYEITSGETELHMFESIKSALSSKVLRHLINGQNKAIKVEVKMTVVGDEPDSYRIHPIIYKNLVNHSRKLKLSLLSSMEQVPQGVYKMKELPIEQQLQLVRGMEDLFHLSDVYMSLFEFDRGVNNELKALEDGNRHQKPHVPLTED